MGDVRKNFQEKVLKINNYLSSFISDKPPKSSSKDENTNTSKTHPANRSEFEARLATFEYGTWIMLEISPLQCAQSGWTYHGTNMLHCATCQAFLCTTLPSPCERDAYSHAISTLKSKLKEHHKMWCGWKNNSSPIEFTMPPLTLSVHYLNDLRLHTKNLISIQNNLPYFITKNMLQKLGIESEDLKVILKDDDFDEVKLTSSILSLCGWRTTNTHQIRCSMCLRSIGLWNFYSLDEKDKYDNIELERAAICEKRRSREIKRQVALEAAKVEEERVLALERKRKEAERELQEDRLLEGADSLPASDLDEAEFMLQSEIGATIAASMDDISAVVSTPSILADLDDYSDGEPTDFIGDDLWIEALGCANDDQGSEALSPEGGGQRWSGIESEAAEPICVQSTTNGDRIEPTQKPVDQETTTKSEDITTTQLLPASDESVLLEKPIVGQNEGSNQPPDSSDGIDCNGVLSNKRKRSVSGEPDETTMKRVCPSSEPTVDSSVSDGNQDEDIVDVEHSKCLFNPIEEHRFWCGWVAPIQNSFNSSRKGFMVIPPQLKAFQSRIDDSDLINSEKYAKNVEGLRAVRTILETSLCEDY